MVTISNQAMNLFNYLENQSATDQALQQIASQQKKDNFQDLSLASSSIIQGNFDELLSDIENGTANINLNTIANYFEFNMNKLNSEITQLASTYQVGLPVEITMTEGQLTVQDSSDAGQALQNYLDKDQRVQNLVNQSSKLSEFFEWGTVREQGLQYQNADIADDALLDFLQAGREQIIHQNGLLITADGAAFRSQHQAEQLIAYYNDKFNYNQEQPNRSSNSNSAVASGSNATAGVSATA